MEGMAVNFLLSITIALLPLYIRISHVDFNRTSKDNLLVVILSCLGFILKSSKRKMSGYFYFVVFYGLFSLTMNQVNPASINSIIQTFYVCSAACFFAHYIEKHDKNSVHYILNGMIAGALIQSAIIIAGYFGQHLYFDLLSIFTNFESFMDSIPYKDNTFGSFGNRNMAGAYLALTTLAFLKLGRTRVIIIAPLVALLLTRSVISGLSFTAGLFYYLNIEYKVISKSKIYITSILAMILFYFTGLNGADSGRFEIWKENFNRVDLKHFFFGKGAGWFSDQGIKYLDMQVGQEHNNFITFFNFFGVIGLLMLLPLFLNFLKSEDKNKIFSSILFVAFCNSYGHFSLHQSTTAIIILITACICLAEGNKNVINMER